MNVTELQNKTIYIDNLADITVDGDISKSSKIIVQETAGAVILETYCYPDFTGVIHLDLRELFVPFAAPAIPDKNGSDSSQTLDLTISVHHSPASPALSYPFTLVLCHSNALAKYSDLDFLEIPDAPVPMAMFVPAQQAVAFETRSKLGVESIHKSPQFQSPTLAYVSVSPSTIMKGPQDIFQLIATCGDSMTKTPFYQVTPGTFQRYLFRNRYGYLEYFPMSGNLQIQPNLKFETSKYGMYNKTAKSDCDVTLQQYTGPLTYTASKVLADMLEDGYAFHYDGQTWRRIVIDSAAVNISSGDSIHKQSFTYRYQEPLSISDIKF